MKKIKLSLFIAMLGLIFVSCERDITEPVISSNPGKPAVSNMSYNGQFNVNNADSLVRFSWSAADFGYQALVTYNVQISSSNNFTGKVANFITVSNTTSGSGKIGDLNALLLSWNLAIGTPVAVYYRVAASVASNVDTIYSEVKTVNLTPYDAVINYPMIYVPGGYQGWSPGAENGRLYSYGMDTKYEGIIRLIDGTNATTQFKVTLKANWDGPNYGGSLTLSGKTYSGVLDPNGNNYEVNAGCYIFEVNTGSLSIKLTRTDDWGIIGDAIPGTGWNSSVPMFYNGQRKMWEVKMDLNAGSFKFRANDSWDLNYGDTGADGTLNAGGDNIVIPAAGNYTIRFDSVNLKYTVIKN
jgi:hypothetical protein